MRACLLVLAGCGRLGFDPSGDAGRTPALCDAKTAGTLALDLGDAAGPETAIAIRAVELAGEYAAVVGTDIGNVYAVRLTADLDLVDQHLPLTGGYVLHGASAIDDRLFIYTAFEADAYLKALDPSWDTYVTAQTGLAASIDAPLARLPGQDRALAGTITTGIETVLTLQIVDGAGVSTGAVADVAPTATAAALAPIPTGARVVYTPDGDRCETLVVSPTGATAALHAIAQCEAPQIVGFADGTGAVLHRRIGTGELRLHVIPSDAAQPGTSIAIGSGPGRLAVIDDTAWIAHAGQLTRVTPEATVANPVGIVTEPFDLAATAMLWIDGNELHAARPCLAP